MHVTSSAANLDVKVEKPDVNISVDSVQIIPHTHTHEQMHNGHLDQTDGNVVTEAKDRPPR